VLCNSACLGSPLVGSETIVVAFSFRVRGVCDIFDVDMQIWPMPVSQIQADARCPTHNRSVFASGIASGR
jgi:hypothetical protein